jgi:hypothetical protein
MPGPKGKNRLRNATPETEVRHPEVNDFECFSEEAGRELLIPPKAVMPVVSSPCGRVEMSAKSILEQNWNIRGRLAICG